MQVRVRLGGLGLIFFGVLGLGLRILAILELVGMLGHARADTRGTPSTIRLANLGA